MQKIKIMVEVRKDALVKLKVFIRKLIFGNKIFIIGNFEFRSIYNIIKVFLNLIILIELFCSINKLT